MATQLTLPQSREASPFDRVPLSIVDDIFAAVARREHHSVPDYDCHDPYWRPDPPSAKPLTTVAKRYTRSGQRAMFLRLQFPSQMPRVARLLQLLRRRPELGAFVRRIDLLGEFWSSNDMEEPAMWRIALAALKEIVRVAAGLRALTTGRRMTAAAMIRVLEVLSTHKVFDRLEMLGLSMYECEEGGDGAGETEALVALVEELQPTELRWETDGDAWLDDDVMARWPVGARRQMAISGPMGEGWSDDVPDAWIERIHWLALGQGPQYEYGMCVPDIGDFTNLRRLDLAGLEFGRETLEALPATLEALEIGHPGDVTDDTFHPTGELGALVTCLASSTWCPALNELVVDLGSLHEYIRDEYEPYHAHKTVYSVHVDDPQVVATIDALRANAKRRGIYCDYTGPPEWETDSERGDQDEYLGKLAENL